LDFWGTKNTDSEARRIIKEIIPEAEIFNEMTTSFGVMAKWKMGNYSSGVFERLLEQLSKI